MKDVKPVLKDAYHMILDAIDTGIYRPGDRLVESELAERFGMSRTPVREALQRAGDPVDAEPGRAQPDRGLARS